jgi:glucose-6-phosphate isomerase
MWDWVGGRTSELSAVGLLPAALQGIQIEEMLRGANECDQENRGKSWLKCPSMLLSLAWFESGNGKGEKNMVLLPYKDRLELFSKYLQQLVMESLGKELDLDKKLVHQGITVLGNKGATDQHSYIQQLRDGLNDYFAIFIEVLKDQLGPKIAVEGAVTSGDFLHGFYLGTRQALAENARESLTITISEVSPYLIGVLIALFERSVSFYASIININAYHQPGVEAGKKAAANVILIQTKITDFIFKRATESLTAKEIAEAIDCNDEIETIFKICNHLSNNPSSKVKKTSGDSPSQMRFFGFS